MGLKHLLCVTIDWLGITKNKWPRILREDANMRQYKRLVGYEFDLNDPKTFTEKIQWYKSRFSIPDMVRYVDKALFKELIAEKLGPGHTIPMYGAYKSVKEFSENWASLPEKFCLKSNLQSDGNYIKVIEKSKTDIDKLCEEIEDWLKPQNLLINSFCSAYYKAVPCIITEEYMESVKNQLYDYKFFCFNGEPYCVYAATEHFKDEHYPISFYDLEWNMLDVQYGEHRKEFVPKPLHFKEMKEIAKVLCQGFPFIRVDFFDTKDKLYVAELTFYPGGGYTLYAPESFNAAMGNMFDLAKCSKR